MFLLNFMVLHWLQYHQDGTVDDELMSRECKPGGYFSNPGLRVWRPSNPGTQVWCSLRYRSAYQSGMRRVHLVVQTHSRGLGL